MQHLAASIAVAVASLFQGESSTAEAPPPAEQNESSARNDPQSLPLDISWQASRNWNELGRLRQHRKNYFLLYSYKSGAGDGIPGGDNYEWEFQISLRSDLWRSEDQECRVAFAYTGHSFWQIFAESSPFRTTDHEPEIFFERDWIMGSKSKALQARVGANHLSNGEAGAASRSMNRAIGEIVYYDRFGSGENKYRMDRALDTSGRVHSLRASARVWGYLNWDDTNNPSPWKYYGYGDIRVDLVGGYDSQPAVGFWVRPSSKSAFEVSASIAPLGGGWKPVRFLARYFEGYGENILEYNQRVSRFGVGIELSL